MGFSLENWGRHFLVAVKINFETETIDTSCVKCNKHFLFCLSGINCLTFLVSPLIFNFSKIPSPLLKQMLACIEKDKEKILQLIFSHLTLLEKQGQLNVSPLKDLCTIAAVVL